MKKVMSNKKQKIGEKESMKVKLDQGIRKLERRSNEARFISRRTFRGEWSFCFYRRKDDLKGIFLS
jgi:hypothetical protein